MNAPMPTVSVDYLPVEPKWMLLDVRWDNEWSGCDHCGRPHKRTFLVEETATGRRMHVGRTCYERLNEPAHRHDLVESGMTDECRYGCKIFRCSCGETEIRHYGSYGCPIGRGEVEAARAGAR